VGVVLQTTRHDPYLTVAETVDLVRGWYAKPLSTDEVLELVSLDEAAGQRAATLSGGQARRLDVALGLVGEPDLLFLDEPTTGFDPQARREAWDVVRRLRHRGTTVVLTTHYLDEAAALADRLLVLARGQIVASGPPATIGGRDRTCEVSFRPEAAVLHDLPAGGELRDGEWRATVSDVTATTHVLSEWAASRATALHGLVVAPRPLDDVYLELIG
jgi:ABC-2 type transport system ATP-binding protein